MFDSKVMTSYQNGTMIQLDANDAVNFLVGLSISVINTVRDTIAEENKFGDMTKKSSDSDVMSMISYYNSGVPEAVYSCILQTNANILLAFVQDIVLNESTRGLYLFYHNTNHRTNAAPYELITKALEDVHQYFMKYGSKDYKNEKRCHFNRYNEDFMNLVKK